MTNYTQPFHAVLALLSGLFILTACGDGFSGGGIALATAQCYANPFAEDCGEEYAQNRETLIAACATDVNKDTRCSIALDHLCGDDPFNLACGDAFLTTTQGRLFAFCTTRDNFDNVLCKNTIEKHPCIAAPFGAECGEKYEPIRTERTAFCAQGDNVTGELCVGATTAQPCLLDPFATDCDDEFAQTHRRVFCTTAGNGEHSLCATLIQGICEADPFIADCGSSKERLALHSTFCTLDGNAGGQTCAGAIAQYPCIENPFGLDCGADYALARTHRADFCSRADNITSPLCTGAVLHDSCVLTPWDLDCGMDYADARMERKGHCFEPANSGDAVCAGFLLRFCTRGGNAADTACAGLIADNLCVAEPSIFGCPIDKQANASRAEFCTQIENAESPICTRTITVLCNDEPFAPHCGARFDNNRAERRAFCQIANNAFDDPACTGAVAFDACIENPFDSACGDDYNTARTLRIAFCTVGEYVVAPLCQPAVNASCMATPFASYCGAEFDPNRVERIAFCIKPINVSNAICQPAFDAICPIEPFTPYCGTLFDNTRSEREAFCKLDGNAVHETCAGAIAQDACIENPFADICTGSYTNARTSRTAFCIKPANVETAICTSAITATCNTEPFANHCGARFDTKRGERKNFCKMGNNAIDTSCAGAVQQIPCIGNPYGAGCGIDFDTQRANRQSFCTQSANVANPLCNNHTFNYCIYGNNSRKPYCGNAVASEPCIRLPFQNGCGIGYNHARGLRLAWCAKGDNALDTVCGDVACIQNPFADSCSADTYIPIQAERIAFCASASNETHSLCAEVNARVTTARWIQGLESPPATAAVMADTGNTFLLGTEDGLDVSDLRDGAGELSTVHTLNLRNGAGGSNLAGSKRRDSANGVGFFHYTPSGGTTRYYAGLFSSVNLGAPLPPYEVGGTQGAHWSGVLHATNLSEPMDISLHIGFTGRTVSGEYDLGGGKTFIFQSWFDDNGLVEGDVTYKTSPTVEREGTVQGLIGQGGVVGMFISDIGGVHGYAGGFIARPPSE